MATSNDEVCAGCGDRDCAYIVRRRDWPVEESEPRYLCDACLDEVIQDDSEEFPEENDDKYDDELDVMFDDEGTPRATSGRSRAAASRPKRS